MATAGSDATHYGIEYDNFTTELITNTKTYNINYDVPLFSNEGGNTSIVTFSINQSGQPKLYCVCKSQTDKKFVIALYNATNGSAVNFSEAHTVYGGDLYINFRVN